MAHVSGINNAQSNALFSGGGGACFVSHDMRGEKEEV